MRSASFRALPVLGILAAIACGGGGGGDGATGPAPLPANQLVQATPDLRFTPGAVSVAVNGKVNFVFGSVGHNVTFTVKDGAPADIAGANQDVTVSRSFTKAGTFAFHCNIHPGMSGSVTVGSTSTGGGGNG